MDITELSNLLTFPMNTSAKKTEDEAWCLLPGTFPHSEEKPQKLNYDQMAAWWLHSKNQKGNWLLEKPDGATQRDGACCTAWCPSQRKDRFLQGSLGPEEINVLIQPPPPPLLTSPLSPWLQSHLALFWGPICASMLLIFYSSNQPCDATLAWGALLGSVPGRRPLVFADTYWIHS